MQWSKETEQSCCFPILIQSIVTMRGSSPSIESSTTIRLGMFKERDAVQPIGLPTKKFCSLPPYARLERVSVIEKRTLPAEHLVERALSISAINEAGLGSKMKHLIDDIKELSPRFSLGLR